MTTANVNENATGAWAIRVGESLEYVRPGANPSHTIVRRPGERRKFGLPTRWLDIMAPFVPATVASTEPEPEPEPECCPTCGKILEES